MSEAKSESSTPEIFERLLAKAADQVSEWNELMIHVGDLLQSKTEPKFHEIQDLILKRLTSNGCSKNQGFIMDGFSMDAEMAAFLFKDDSADEFEFNKLTKPDFVIIMNRIPEQEALCSDVIQPVSETSNLDSSKSEMIQKLQNY